MHAIGGSRSSRDRAVDKTESLASTTERGAVLREAEPSKATYMLVGEAAATAAAAGMATSVAAGAVRRGDAVLMVGFSSPFLPRWGDDDQWSERWVERGRGSGSLLGWAIGRGGDLAGHDRPQLLGALPPCLWWSVMVWCCEKGSVWSMIACLTYGRKSTTQLCRCQLSRHRSNLGARPAG